MSQFPPARFLDRSTPPHMITLVALTAVSAMSMNIILPALPQMTRYFDSTYGFMQLSVSLYMGILAVQQLILGPLSDKYGRRPVIIGSLSIFILASFGSMFATSAGMFLAFRMLQTTCVAGMALGRASVRDVYPPDQAASQLGYVTMFMAIVPMVAPAFGGFLAQHISWQGVFLVMALFGLLVLLITLRDMGETAPLDGGGFVDQFRQWPELFGAVRFWGYALVATFASGAFFAYVGGAPFVGGQIYGLNETQLGMAIGAPAIGYLLGNFASARLSMRLGVHTMIVTGSLINIAGTAAMLTIVITSRDTAILFFALMTPIGVGNGLILPNATSGLMSVRPRLAGTASGLGGAFMLAGGAALAATSGAMLSTETGSLPLLIMMFSVSVLALASIYMVIWRSRQLSR